MNMPYCITSYKSQGCIKLSYKYNTCAMCSHKHGRVQYKQTTDRSLRSKSTQDTTVIIPWTSTSRGHLIKIITQWEDHSLLSLPGRQPWVWTYEVLAPVLSLKSLNRWPSNWHFTVSVLIKADLGGTDGAEVLARITAQTSLLTIQYLNH